MKEIVTISRYWNKPFIKVVVTNDDISLSIPLVDFIDAVKKEIGSVRWIIKNETFEYILDKAVKVVIEKVKEESSKGV
jgi:hypothetical protein